MLLSLSSSELKRSIEFANNAINDISATANIRDIAYESDIDPNELIGEEFDEFEEDDDS